LGVWGLVVYSGESGVRTLCFCKLYADIHSGVTFGCDGTKPIER
jgi:hypothetical protein